MGCRIGQAGKTSWGFLDYVPFILGGGLAAYGIYKLLWPKVGESIAPVAPKKAPAKYADFKAVVDRFLQVKELWRMGYIEAPQVVSELKTLTQETLTKIASSQVDRDEGEKLIAQIRSFSNDVSANVIGLTGNRYRVVRRIG